MSDIYYVFMWLTAAWLTLVEDGLVVVGVCFTQQELEDHFCSSVPFHTLQSREDITYSTQKSHNPSRAKRSLWMFGLSPPLCLHIVRLRQPFCTRDLCTGDDGERTCEHITRSE